MMEKATFAGGCFWCIETAFKIKKGVIKIISGYTGGTLQNPTYEDVCSGTTGHHEAVEIMYDPSMISYEEVLNMQPRYFIIMKIKKSLLKNQGRRYKSSLTSLLQPKYYRQNHFILLKYIIRILPTKTRHFISNIMQVLEEKVILKKSGRNRIPRIN